MGSLEIPMFILIHIYVLTPHLICIGIELPVGSDRQNYHSISQILNVWFQYAWPKKIWGNKLSTHLFAWL
jgi:hypothetical protein